MKNLKKELRALNKDLKSLAKKTEGLLKMVDKIEKPKVKAVKPKPKKKVVAKKPVVKKAAQLSAIDTVFGFIKRSKKGVTTATLMEKTGFEQKKTFNIIYKLKTQGKIKTVERGVYVKV